MYAIPDLPLTYSFETVPIMKKLIQARAKLAELKGIAHTIPNESILINTLALQEAKDSSAVENITTTQDELFKADLSMQHVRITSATKEVLQYAEALKTGFSRMRRTSLLTTSMIIGIQEILEQNRAGFRSVPGTTLQDQDGKVVYTPPQNRADIERHMANLERFMNDESVSDLDPLIKMAIIHHQFESIHPFYDGNGRTGRIINILYLVSKDLLDLPILYLSRYIIQNKQEYYRLLQGVRDEQSWEEWILFLLEGVRQTAHESIVLVKGIVSLMANTKDKLRDLLGGKYRHELLNNLFNHPYTRIGFVMTELDVSRITAVRYLDLLVDQGVLEKLRLGRSNYYLNTKLIDLLLGQG